VTNSAHPSPLKTSRIAGTDEQSHSINLNCSHGVSEVKMLLLLSFVDMLSFPASDSAQERRKQQMCGASQESDSRKRRASEVNSHTVIGITWAAPSLILSILTARSFVPLQTHQG